MLTSPPQSYSSGNNAFTRFALHISSGTATASVLYDPYGRTRYSTGAMPGSRGFTNQHSDSTTGLDDYGARYYDAVAGAFVSADTASDGLNEYAYVHGNPETFSDPSGHRECYNDCGASEPPAPSTNPPCTSNCTPSPCGGCTQVPGKPANPSSPTGPSPAQIAQARQDALRTAAMFALWAGGLAVAAGLVALADATNPLLTIVLAFVFRALTVMSFEALALAGEFGVEGTQGSAFWSDSSNLGNFEVATILTVTAISLAAIVLGGFLQAALSKALGAITGAVLGPGLFIRMAVSAVQQQASDLGFGLNSL